VSALGRQSRPRQEKSLLETVFPLWVHLRGLPEVLLQSLFLSLLLFYWVNHPEKRWLNWVLGITFFVVMLFPVLGLLVTQPK